MKFLNEEGREITLKRAENLPGYEVTLSEDVVIESAVDNPFFKGINILQLPKKLKGFRKNSDLKNLLKPQTLTTNIRMDSADNKLGIFCPTPELRENNRLLLDNGNFFSGQLIKPSFINFGLKPVILHKHTVIGVIVIIDIQK